MTDLFDKRTSKEKLLDWMRQKKEARTSDIIKWGVDNYSNRADRNARQLASEGYLRRMDDSEKRFRFHDCKEDVWVYVGKGS